jgi:hypothetical protein
MEGDDRCWRISDMRGHRGSPDFAALQKPGVQIEQNSGFLRPAETGVGLKHAIAGIGREGVRSRNLNPWGRYGQHFD